MTQILQSDEFTERAAPYALGALSQIEARAFEDHLAEGCSACLQELESFNEVTAKLAFGVEFDEPSSKVEEKILGEILKQPVAPNIDQTKEVAPAPTFLSIHREEGRWLTAGDGIQVKFLYEDEAS